jgi:molybdopterin-containing oxidoreductase family iron-sulfur binding subunit
MHARETSDRPPSRPPAGGAAYWRGLEELADTAAFREMMAREFPEQAGVWADPVTRRQFLTVMGASLALAGVGGCARPPSEKIVPYVRQPEQVTPGKALYFATAMPLAGDAVGLLVENHEGRPTKVEGNPDHPASLGATDAFAQASILGLYDPDRSKTLTYLGRIRGWNEALTALQKYLARLRTTEGAGFHILSETVTSPTLARQLETLTRTFRNAKWHQYEPGITGNSREGARIAFGDSLEPHYQLAGADVILALDADFLTAGPNHLRHLREFALRRRPDGERAMSRLYAVESTPTSTGMVADHRLPLRASQIEAFARALAGRLGVLNGGDEQLPDRLNRWLEVLAKDLQGHPGRCVVVAGDGQPAAVHAIAHAVNAKLGNLNKTVRFTKPADTRPTDQIASLRALCEEMDQPGKVELLLILGGNPVYTAPADLRFKERLAKVPLKVHLGLYDDETAEQCQWHIPEAHFLETWSDTRAADGTATIMQPLIAPLYGGKSAHEVLASFSDQPNQTGHELVKDYWREQWQKERSFGDFDSFWRRSLHDGVVAGTAFPIQNVTLRADWATEVTKRRPAPLNGPTPNAGAGQELEIIFRTDPTVFDGRFANNGWLQELPKPLTKLTWDNAVLVSPATARAIGVNPIAGRHGGPHGELITDVVELQYFQTRDGTKEPMASVRAPVLPVPGHPDGSVTVHLGYGRTRAGQLGTGAGFNAFHLRTSDAPSFDGGAVLRRTGVRFTLACTQFHHMLETEEQNREAEHQVKERGIIRVATLKEYEKNSHFASAREHHPAKPEDARKLPEVEGLEHKEERVGRLPLSLYGEKPEHHGPAWAMAIDLNGCIGCGACVVACQAENNSPVVGKDQVTRGREMHWLRIDRYYQGEPENPQAYLQPMLCQHCENAPCEVVCPVEATSHSPDGLNEMTYNRCVGTRYCSNNCPYKVRRFNFLQYADYATASLKLQRNPEVTVRSRGVMEKCTYCVQRIRNAEIDAKNQHRDLRDGDIITACQAACPAQAIVFGNLNDPDSQVVKQRRSPLNYGVLAELNTRPRTTYLAAVRNPNPDLAAR